MIVFYSDNIAVNTIIPIQQEVTSCATSCNGCIKPKSKCCNKYKKKGVNCKRCPLTFDLKAAS